VREILKRFGVFAIGKITCIELDPKNCQRLRSDGFITYEMNFLDFEGRRDIFDRVLMNPPFTRGQDMAHIRHAFDLLKTGGRLVAICSEGPFFRSDKASEAFRELVDDNGWSKRLPEGAFSTSGTMVNTRIVVLDK
jgi:16S rRNA G1207 methylase RsmC